MAVDGAQNWFTEIILAEFFFNQALGETLMYVEIVERSAVFCHKQTLALQAFVLSGISSESLVPESYESIWKDR